MYLSHIVVICHKTMGDNFPAAPDHATVSLCYINLNLTSHFLGQGQERGKVESHWFGNGKCTSQVAIQNVGKGAIMWPKLTKTTNIFSYWP